MHRAVFPMETATVYEIHTRITSVGEFSIAKNDSIARESRFTTSVMKANDSPELKHRVRVEETIRNILDEERMPLGAYVRPAELFRVETTDRKGPGEQICQVLPARPGVDMYCGNCIHRKYYLQLATGDMGRKGME